ASAAVSSRAGEQQSPKLAANPSSQNPPFVASRSLPPVAEQATVPVAAYSAGITDQRLYTSDPQVEQPAAVKSPANPAADNAGPIAQTAQTPRWSSAAWAIAPSDAPAT